jgi:outer membrane protein, heavy metal efflux system
MLFRSVLFAVGALIPVVSAGQTTGQFAVPVDTMQVVHLNQLLDAVPVSNTDLRALRLKTDALFLKSPQVSAWPDPMVGMTYLPSPIYTARGAQQYQIRAEQTIPFPGKLGLKEEIADMNAIIDSIGTDAIEDNLLLRVKLAYFDLYRMQQIEALIHEFQEKLRDFEAVAATQYEVGRGMQQAIVKAQLERNTLSTRLLNLSWQRRSATEVLSGLVNRPVAFPGPIEIEMFADQRPVFDIEKLLWVAIKNRPESIALDSSIVRADLSIDLAGKMFYPDFSVGATYFGISESDIPPNSDGKNAFAIGLSVKIPLQRGRLKAQEEEARVNRSRVETGMESLIVDFRTTISDLVSRVEEDERQLELYKNTLIPQAETTLEATLSAYTTGRTDFLNLLDSERVLFMVHTGFEDIYARRLKTLAMLEKELGVKSLSDNIYN